MLQFFVRELQGRQTSDQVQKLVVNDCEMSSTKKLRNIIYLKCHFKIINKATRAAVRPAGCTCLF